MTVAQAVRTRLLACSAVTTLVGQRVYKDILPEQATLPAVRVQRISQVEDEHLRGVGGMNTSRVQIDSIAATKADAEALDAAVAGDGRGDDATGVLGWFGSFGSPAFEVDAILPIDVRDTYEPDEHRQFRVMRDVRVFWKQMTA